MSTLKNYVTVLFLFLFFSSYVFAQKDNDNWANLSRYANQNQELKEMNKSIKAVFIGNSITEGWAHVHPQFFEDNGYVGRGIGGQTIPQFLSRFRNDVIDLKPKVVVINGGINDIAGNTGEYNKEYTLNCLYSIAELADANGIKVVLTSVLPAAYIPWREDIPNIPAKVAELNSAIREYAKKKGFEYVDYYASMVDENQGLKKEFTTDEVHVTEAGYSVMESIIKEKINNLLSNIYK